MSALSLAVFIIALFFDKCISSFSTTAVDYISETTTGYGGLVSSPHYLATEVGIDILKQGGSAADAAIAVQLTLGIVQPAHSGICGGSISLIYDSNTNKVYTLDAREEAPSLYNPYVFCSNDINCFEPSKLSQCNCTSMTKIKPTYGGISIGVPGVIHGLYKLHKYFGELSWNKLFDGPINIANNTGFDMYHQLYDLLNDDYNGYKVTPKLRISNATIDLYYNEVNGTLVPKYRVGEKAYNKDFANTLSKLSESAEKAIELFYKGEIADAIVNAATNAVYNDRYSLITNEDMGNYTSLFREPYVSNFNNTYNIYGASMPGSGSLTVQMGLQLLYNSIYKLNNNETKADFGSTIWKDYDINSATILHYMANAQGIAYADRNEYFSDNDFNTEIDFNLFLNKNYLLQRSTNHTSSNFTSLNFKYGNPNKTFDDIYGDYDSIDEGTTHFIVIDKNNNVVSTTVSLNGPFGSGIAVPGYGMLLNNQLDDFDDFGFKNGETVLNGPESGRRQHIYALDVFDLNDTLTFGAKRPRSSMAPIIVMDINNTKPIYSAGVNGGGKIPGGAFSILTRLLFNDLDPQEAVNAPRVWCLNDGKILAETNITGSWYDNTEFTDVLLQKGYNLSESINPYKAGKGEASAIKIEYSNDGVILKGAAEYNRYETAKVTVVCKFNTDNNDVFNCGKDLKQEKTVFIVITISIVIIIFITIIGLSIYFNTRKKDNETTLNGDSRYQKMG